MTSTSFLDDSSALGGWGDREVGDETTNPVPTFVGRGISGMFFYQNRLGFLSEDAVILSQPGDYFNFWNNSAITISDADPIDMMASPPSLPSCVTRWVRLRACSYSLITTNSFSHLKRLSRS